MNTSMMPASVTAQISGEIVILRILPRPSGQPLVVDPDCSYRP
jgi:hypothetical protein